MHVLKINTGHAVIYLVRKKEFDVLKLFQDYTSEFRKDVKINRGIFQVHIPLFIEYLIQFQDFVRFNHRVREISLKQE